MQPATSLATDSAECPRTIQRLLIVRLSAMGDVLHTLSAAGALRLAMPETHFGWIVEERWADLVRYACVRDGPVLTPIVDEVHKVNLKKWRRSLASINTWRRIHSCVTDLRAAHYDVAVDFQGAARSALVARLSQAPSICGFAEPRENVASMFYTSAVVTNEKHVVAQTVALASAIAQRRLPAARIEFTCQGCANSVPTLPSDYVILNPGAGWGAKQWPAERYGEVAKRLAEELQLRCFINGGPGEHDLIRTAQSASHGSAQPIACSPLELVDVVRSARLFIGGDTGPMHLAATLRVPVVAIFGPTDPARNGPFGTRSIVLRSPDSRTSLSHMSSPDSAMLQITTDDVVGAAIQLLRETRE
ncbi:MAG TPA: glycosyltransferase family 9 protein [Terriglobales bacterium]|nr:glycosyltransferase family 9 protein [Terriglobales bacterium]